MSTSTLTYHEMLAQREALDRKIQAIESKRNEALIRVCRVIDEYGLSTEEIEAQLKAMQSTSKAEEKDTSPEAPKPASPSPKATKKRAASKKSAQKRSVKDKQSLPSRVKASEVIEPKQVDEPSKKEEVKILKSPLTDSIPTGESQKQSAPPAPASDQSDRDEQLEAPAEGVSLTPVIPTAKDNETSSPSSAGPRFSYEQ